MKELNAFERVKIVTPSSSYFDLSHDIKTSFRMGHLVPSLFVETMPGDRFKISCEFMARLAPLISPVMHRVNVYAEFFYVPNRILWPDFNDWIFGSKEVQVPYIEMKPGYNWRKRTVFDYLGYPIIPSSYNHAQTIRVLPFRLAAYSKIWNEYYRDQNLQIERNSLLVSGENDGTNRVYNTSAAQVPQLAFGPDAALLRRAWRHDYYTSCLPFAQKGQEVAIPLTSAAGVVQLTPGVGTPSFKNPLGDPLVTEKVQTDSQGNVIGETTQQQAYYDPEGSLTVDIQANATGINDLRRAFRLQEWLEKNARAGNRPWEAFQAHFGIVNPDARLQRPEYIGSYRGVFAISEVLATAQDLSANVPVGYQAGRGISYFDGQSFGVYCPEHGYVMGFVSVLPEASYMDGIDRDLVRFDRFDYAWPTFANIGEQAVLNKEILATHPDPEGTFGYLPRYSEYRYQSCRVTGDFRDSLDFWHLARRFAPGSNVALNEDFIECNPSDRIFAVTDQNDDHIYAVITNRVGVRRLLPQFGTPTI